MQRFKRLGWCRCSLVCSNDGEAQQSQSLKTIEFDDRHSQHVFASTPWSSKASCCSLDFQQYYWTLLAVVFVFLAQAAAARSFKLVHLHYHYQWPMVWFTELASQQPASKIWKQKQKPMHIAWNRFKGTTELQDPALHGSMHFAAVHLRLVETLACEDIWQVGLVGNLTATSQPKSWIIFSLLGT